MDDKGQWCLAPAYDLTFSSGPGGEQSTMVMGQGKAITDESLMALASEASIHQKIAKTIISDVSSALSQWKRLAKQAGVSRENTQQIEKNLM